MLRPDPAQAMRRAEIITNLHERIREANERGWLGEAEGLQVSLAGARQKLTQMRKLRQTTIAIDQHTKNQVTVREGTDSCSALFRTGFDGDIGPCPLILDT